jgi:hypothetical protein
MLNPPKSQDQRLSGVTLRGTPGRHCRPSSAVAAGLPGRRIRSSPLRRDLMRMHPLYICVYHTPILRFPSLPLPFISFNSPHRHGGLRTALQADPPPAVDSFALSNAVTIRANSYRRCGTVFADYGHTMWDRGLGLDVSIGASTVYLYST